MVLRTQQIIAEETGVTRTVDPLGGSYFIEWITDRLEREAMVDIDKIDALGGIVLAIERGFSQKEIGDAAYHYQKQIEKGEKTVVGVNKYSAEKDSPIPILKIDGRVEQRQVENLKRVKADHDAVQRQLGLIRQALNG